MRRAAPARRLSTRSAAAAFALAVLGLAACASPAARIDRRAAGLGLSRAVIAGEPFRHVAYFRSDVAPPGAPLHVYIEHDGTPWIGADRVAADPTPREPLMLELMALDPAPVLYLGRPCHLGLADDPPCTPLTWTHRRYSAEVVDSLAAALRRVLADRPHMGLVFVGHSGGGTLAVLLAERFDTTVAVVTLGANLDIDQWASLHGYSPLAGSLNPIERPSLPSRVVQRHYVGADDRSVPPHIVRAYVARHPSAEAVVVPGIDHACCWGERWPGVLADLRGRLAPR